MRRSRVAILATAALTLTTASAAQARDHGHGHGHHGHGVSSKQLQRAVKVKGIVKHQRALQRIADLNGGTRYTTTPGYTASVAYVAERMRRAGLDVEVTQFDMPDWHETAPPVFQQLTPDAKTYTPGTAADNDSPAVDYITFAYSPTAEVASAPVVPTERHRDPEPGGRTRTPAAARRRTSPPRRAGRSRWSSAAPAASRNKLANAEAAGAVGVIMFNEGDSPGRSNAGFRAGADGPRDPGRVLELRASARSSTTPTRRVTPRPCGCRPAA